MKKETKEKIKKETYEWIKSIIIALIIALILRHFVVESYATPTTSMEPTVKIGDRMFCNKFIYRFEEPQRGDIVVFKPPSKAEAGKRLYLKRIIGVEGENIEIKNGKVYINGKSLKEPYIKEEPYYEGCEYCKMKIPKGTVFAMGDNRNNSADSHIWGPLSKKNILGRIFVTYWPPGRIHIFKKENYPN